MNIGSFEEAFRDGLGFEIPVDEPGRDCACGREFNSGSYMTFEGTEYIIDCTCWHKRAEQVMKFIDGHAVKIARYLTLEKNRKTAEAARMPVVPE